MMDVVTPILLSFVYLYIFNVDFQQTLTLYVKSVGVIACVCLSSFSYVSASISFMIALDPFLFRDKLWMNDFFGVTVKKMQLASLVLSNLRTKSVHAFENHQLDASRK